MKRVEREDGRDVVPHCKGAGDGDVEADRALTPSSPRSSRKRSRPHAIDRWCLTCCQTSALEDPLYHGPSFNLFQLPLRFSSTATASHRFRSVFLLMRLELGHIVLFPGQVVLDLIIVFLAEQKQLGSAKSREGSGDQSSPAPVDCHR